MTVHDRCAMRAARPPAGFPTPSKYVNMGWRAMEGACEFYFSDHACSEIDSEPNPEAVKLGVDPYADVATTESWIAAHTSDQSLAGQFDG